jgi:hypothetical protein
MAVTTPPYAPPGPPAGTPPAPKGATPWWQSRTLRYIISGTLIVAAIVVFFVGRSSNKASADVALVGKDTPGNETFTPPVAAPSPPQAANTATAPAPSSGGLITANGDAAGLYAGQRDVPSCNATQLTSYLEANPAKQKAWAQAINLQPTDVKQFIATLTSVNLRVDTRVTEYKFADNKPQPHQSVLQSGTAVMLDRTGFPRVRCQSGNPLGEPRAVSSSPSYTGAAWPGFSPRQVVIVKPAQNTGPFILIDSPTGSIFLRIPGGIADINRPPTGVTIQLCEPGGPFGVTGSRFPPGTPITLTWDNPPVTLANITADGGGNFSVQVTCPPDTPIGVHQVTATGGGFTLAQPVYAIAPAPPRRGP